MTAEIRDYTPLLRGAIAEAKAACFEAAAIELQQASLAAFTTSSEMLQEHGLAIKRFLKASRGALPPETRAKLEACLAETELGCTGWRKLSALVRRRRTLG